MKTQYTLRNVDITLEAPTVEEIVDAVGEEKVLHALVSFVVYHKIGSKIDSLRKDDPTAEVPTEWSMLDESLWNAPGTRRSTYPVPASFMEQARKALVAAGKLDEPKTKLKDFDTESDDFSKITKVATHLYNESKKVQKGLDELIG